MTEEQLQSRRCAMQMTIARAKDKRRRAAEKARNLAKPLPVRSDVPDQLILVDLGDDDIRREAIRQEFATSQARLACDVEGIKFFDDSFRLFGSRRLGRALWRLKHFLGLTYAAKYRKQEKKRQRFLRENVKRV